MRERRIARLRRPRRTRRTRGARLCRRHRPGGRGRGRGPGHGPSRRQSWAGAWPTAHRSVGGRLGDPRARGAAGSGVADAVRPRRLAPGGRMSFIVVGKGVTVATGAAGVDGIVFDTPSANKVVVAIFDPG